LLYWPGVKMIQKMPTIAFAPARPGTPGGPPFSGPACPRGSEGRPPMLAWRTDPVPQVVTVCGVEIDVLRRRVRVDGRNVGQLSDREFRLLHFLASNAGIVFSREKLLARLWRRDGPQRRRNDQA